MNYLLTPKYALQNVTKRYSRVTKDTIAETSLGISLLIKPRIEPFIMLDKHARLASGDSVS